MPSIRWSVRDAYSRVVLVPTAADPAHRILSTKDTVSMDANRDAIHVPENTQLPLADQACDRSHSGVFFPGYTFSSPIFPNVYLFFPQPFPRGK